ncbi:MAG: YitT family protein [Tannerella sp.]|jgi:uncharacterized membrane-anchored protein YitT (DUF2179 family)|nr:YitT family protein [Tannerella sp.]
METNKMSLYKLLRTYFIISIGLFIYVFAWKAFLIPNGIVGGGATGLATVIYYLSGKLIPVQYGFFAINVVLVIIGFKVLGRSFGAKTIYGIAFTFSMLAALPEPEIITKSFIESDKLLCAIIGGIVSGAGIAISFTQGGSAGGTDIIAWIVNKYRDVTPGKIFLYSDLFIIGSSFFINWDFRTVVYGYVVMGVFSYSVDILLSGTKQSVQIFILSDKYDEIATKINQDLHRGVTALHATGWYSKEERRVLMIMARKYELSTLYQIIKSVDNEAFISVANVMGVFGKGFDPLKTKKKITKV